LALDLEKQAFSPCWASVSSIQGLLFSRAKLLFPERLDCEFVIGGCDYSY